VAKLPDTERITIIGPGLLGASVGLGLKRAGYGGTIVGVARRRATLDEAVRRGAIDEATHDLAAAVAGSGLAIVAVPLGGFDAVFAALAEHDHDGLIITDVGSTKRPVQDAADRRLPDPTRFVAAHPMAGSEQTGPGAAKGDLFEGKPCILCPADGCRPDAVATVEALWSSLGMRLLRMSADEHDRAAAATSHLPHAAACTLVAVAEALGGWGVASTGFRDTTRLASSNPPMRADIMRANRGPLVETIERCRDELAKLAAMVQADDPDALVAWLEARKAARDLWLDARRKG